MEQAYQSLSELIKFVLSNTKAHICIHDLSGLLRHPIFEVHPRFTIHSSPICDYSKTTTKGMNRCMACKIMANNKAVSAKKLFVGSCMSGLTEISLPVVKNGTVVCIIYVGNLILSQEKTMRKMIHTAKLTGVDKDVLLSLIHTAQNVKNLDYYIKMTKLLRSYILLLLDQYPIKHSENEHWAVYAIKNYIILYYNQPLTLSRLAQLYYFNEKYIGRLFKKEMGQNFNDYLNTIRIQKAKELLKCTDDTVLNISIQVGFENVTYFNRVFKKITGQTPQQYRKSENEKDG